jgi:hypothetical protein
LLNNNLWDQKQYSTDNISSRVAERRKKREKSKTIQKFNSKIISLKLPRFKTWWDLLDEDKRLLIIREWNNFKYSHQKHRWGDMKEMLDKEQRDFEHFIKKAIEKHTTKGQLRHLNICDLLG